MSELIRKAFENDTEAILQIFKNVTELLINNGVSQWDFSYPNLETTRKDIETGCCYLCLIDDQIAGVITVNQNQDEQYKNVHWIGKEDSVWVIHRLAINPQFQNKGLGKKMCLFAEDLVLKEAGSSIRLDAFSENPYSNRMYKNLGYSLMNEKLYFHGNPIPFNAYEKLL